MKAAHRAVAGRFLAATVTLLFALASYTALAPLAQAGQGAVRPSSGPDKLIFLPLLAKPIPSDMVLVPAGGFRMGCDPTHNGGYDCSSQELPLHSVNLDSYSIDKFEVTNARYAECVTAKACTPPADSSSWTRPSYYGNAAYGSFPVIHVTFTQADAYCRWAGQRLPTEAEWEKAARGQSGARAYPWGDQAPGCALANFFDRAPIPPCVGDTSAVGSYPGGASPYGAQDMAGNVLEWVHDWYDAGYYTVSPASNPPGPAAGSLKVKRGGGWDALPSTLKTAYRDFDDPAFQDFDLGFRCVRAP